MANNFQIRISNDPKRLEFNLLYFEIYLKFEFCLLGFNRRVLGKGIGYKIL